MELLDFILVLIVFAGCVALGFRYLAMKDVRERYKQETERKKSLLASQARSQRGMPQRMQEQEPEERAEGSVGAWVPALLESFGVDPETLFEDEAPEELTRLLPLVKGFVDASGGVEGVISKFAKPNTAPIDNSGWN